MRSGEKNSPERGYCQEEDHRVAVGYGALSEQQEGQRACGLVSKVGADGPELGETERGQSTGRGDDFDLILYATEVNTLQVWSLEVME